MSLINEFQDIQGQPLMARSRNAAYFDFVIAERPTYIPNSGPPLEPMSIMPAHDKDGVIDGEFTQPDNRFTYVVTFPDNPTLRISVKPQNIRKWVSARTLENWNLDESNRKEKQRTDNLREKKNARAKKADLSRVANGEKKKKGKANRPKGGKRKLDEVEGAEMSSSARRRSSAATVSGLLAGPTRMRKQLREEPAVFTSPRRPQLARGPSLTTPVKSLASIVASMDDLNPTDTDEMDEGDEEDDNDEEEAIAAQLNSPSARNSRSRSNTKTPGPSSCSQRGSNPGNSSNQQRREGTFSAAVSDEDAVIHQMSSQEQQAVSVPSPFFSGRNPTAASSSRDALKTYESLERQKFKQAAPNPLPKSTMPAIDEYSQSWDRTSPGVSKMSASSSSQVAPTSRDYVPPGFDEDVLAGILERQKVVSIQALPNAKEDSYTTSKIAKGPEAVLATVHAPKPNEPVPPNSGIDYHPNNNASQPKMSSLSIAEKYSSFWDKAKNKVPTMFNINRTSSMKSPLKSVHKQYEYRHSDDQLEDLGEESEPEQDNLTTVDRHVDNGEVGNEEDGDEDEEDEQEWELEAILRDSQRVGVDGTLKQHYLIKWVGDWDNSWEPAENINQQLRDAYHARKDRLAAQEAGKEKKGKKVPRKGSRQRGLHEDDNIDEDDESTFGGTPLKSRIREVEKPVDPDDQHLFVTDDEPTPRNKGKEPGRGGHLQSIYDLASDSKDDSEPFAD